MNNNNLYFLYIKVINIMYKKYFYKSIMQAPKINKLIINMGLGKFVNDKKNLEYAINDLIKITGQKPIITKSKKSISNFKIHKGYNIGCKVTLRNKRMWSFIEKLIYVAIPRIHDFRGLSCNSFDKNGNFNFGIKEQIIFPEIEYDKIDKIRGMDINISIKSNSINESIFLLKNINFPLKI